MKRRMARALLVALVAAGVVGWRPHVAAQSPMPPCGIAMRVLVLAATGQEVELPAITTALDYVGTPYDVFITDSTINPNPLTLETASCTTSSSTEAAQRGFYQAVILTRQDSVGGYGQIVADYEKKYGVRQVTWYAYWPSIDDGFTPASGSSGSPLPATLTAAGQSVFPYLVAGTPANPIVIDANAWVVHATADASTTATLLTDTQGDALAAIHTYADGRQNLVMTFDSNPYMLHSMLLSYGVIDWATQGLFIGERHTYVSPQIDDVFIDDEQWTVNTACGTSVDATGLAQRITGDDLTALSNWQASKRQSLTTPDLKITMAFNGLGTTTNYDFSPVGGSDNLIVGGSTTAGSADTLSAAATQQEQNYYWASHTYDHENLDNLTYDKAAAEIQNNNTIATNLKLEDYTRQFMVQPDVSGLANPAFLSAAYDNGIRYVLSNTSKPGQNNPTPNAGYWDATDPRMFVIPRRANNLFFNVANPADWVAEYNCLYGPNGTLRLPDGSPFFTYNLTYRYDTAANRPGILDVISDELVADLLRGELDPWMFHQTNLAAYDGTHSLLGDLLDLTFQKYSSYVAFPISSPSIDILGGRMKDRTTFRNTAGFDATIKPGVAIVFTSPVAVTVPVTGLKNGAEQYAGQWISWVPLAANTPLTLPFIPPFVSENSTSGDGPGTRSITLSTAQPGDLLVAFVGAGGAGQTATLSGAGLTWTLVKRVNTQAGTSEIWSATAATRLTNVTITSTLAIAGYDQSLTVVPFAGSGGVGAWQIANASSGAPSLSLTTTKHGSFVYAVGNDAKRAVARSLGANQWMVHQFVDNAAADTFWVQALSSPVPSPGTVVKMYDTAPTKDTWNFAAVEIVPAPKVVAVPQVVGMTQAAATTAIDAAGLIVGKVTYVMTDDTRALAVNQTPSAGTSAGTDTSVDLVISIPHPVASSITSTTSTGNGSVSVSTASGQLLVAFVSADGPSQAQTVTVSGGGLTWTRVGRANAQRGTAEVWKAKANASATIQVTSAEAKSGYRQAITVIAFTGAGDTGASRIGSASSGAPSLSLTTTKAQSLVYGIGFDSSSAAPRTLGAGQVMINEYPGTSTDAWLQSRTGLVPASGTTVIVNDTAPTADRWNLGIVEIAVP